MNLFEEEKCFCPANKIAYDQHKWTYNDINGNWISPDTDILIIQEHREYHDIQEVLHKIFHSYFGKYKYTIIYALGCTPKEDKNSDIIANYLHCKKYNINKLIKQFTPKIIITTGRAIYTLTESKDLRHEHFYSLHKDDISFFSSEYNCQVFPIPSIYQFMGYQKRNKFISILDNWEYYFTKLQFNRAIDNLFNYEKEKIPQLNYIEPKDYNIFLQELIANISIEWIAVDIETTGLNYWTDKIISIQIAFDELNGYFFNFEKLDKNLFNELLKCKKQIYHNGKFDRKFLLKNDLNFSNIDYDTMIAHYALNENCRHGLKLLAYIYTKYGGYDRNLKAYLKLLEKKDFSLVPKQVLLEYACADTIITYQLFNYFNKRFEEEIEVKANYYDYMLPALNMFCEIEMNGIQINENYYFKYNSDLVEELSKIDNNLRNLIGGKSINFRSSRQLSIEIQKDKNFKILNDDSGKPLLSKNGDILLNKDTLPLYVEQGVKICEFLEKRNNLVKEISQLSIEKAKEKFEINDANNLFSDIIKIKPTITFTDLSDNSDKGILSSVYNNRLYGEFNVAGTTTGRLSSSGGLQGSINFQNFPKKKEFRMLFKPTDGFIFCETDFVGMEITQGSQIYGTGVLEKFVLEDLDFHSNTGTKVYEILTKKKISYEEFYEKAKIQKIPQFVKIRDKAKSVNFSITYGTTKYGIARVLNITPDEAEIFLKSFYVLYPEIKAYFDEFREHAKQYGYVINMLNKKRRIPTLTYIGKDSYINEELNEAINSPIQGLSGQTTYIGMTNIHKKFKEGSLKSRILANIHDAVLTEIYIPEKEKAINIIEECLTKPYYHNRKGNKCTLKVEHTISNIWGFK